MVAKSFHRCLLQDEKVRCPMSGKPIKLKDLTEVHFTPIKDRDEKTALISKQVDVLLKCHLFSFPTMLWSTREVFTDSVDKNNVHSDPESTFSDDKMMSSPQISLK